MTKRHTDKTSHGQNRDIVPRSHSPPQKNEGPGDDIVYFSLLLVIIPSIYFTRVTHLRTSQV